jgi:hypothetical protein
MTRRHHLILALLLCLPSVGALAAKSASPLVGKWKAVQIVSPTGDVVPFANRPTDNPRMDMTFTFGADGSYVAWTKVVFKAGKNEEADKKFGKKDFQNEVEVTGTWSLSGSKLTVVPMKPRPSPAKTFTIKVDGDVLALPIPEVGSTVRFARTR